MADGGNPNLRSGTVLITLSSSSARPKLGGRNLTNIQTKRLDIEIIQNAGNEHQMARIALKSFIVEPPR